MRGIILSPAKVGLSTGSQEYSFGVNRPVVYRVSLLLGRGVFMNVQYSDIAIGSNPVFNLTLRDVEALYVPEAVYYQVQGQNKDTLEWEDVGTVQKLNSSLETTFKIVLPSELTGKQDSQNLNRRLIVEVFYTDKGQTIQSTQVIEFELVDVPSLSSGYTPETGVELSASISSSGDVGTASYVVVSTNKPLKSCDNPIITYTDLEEHELTATPEVFMLSGNNATQFLFSVEGTPISLACKLTSLDGDTLDYVVAL